MSQDPYRYFRIEARELLEQLGTGLLELERGPPTAELVPRLLRLAHTLKGAARVVKLPAMAEQAHALEDGLAPLRQEPRALGHEQIDALLKRLDALAALLRGLDAPVASAARPAEPPRSEPETRAAGETPKSAPREMAGANEEELAALCTGMVEVRSRVGALRRQLGTRETALTTHLGQLEHEVGEVGDMAERLALAPASRMLARLERATRDLGRELGRGVQFEGRGGDVRLDRHVLSAVERALVQLVRNAVAHGIELAAERQALGKPAEGRVVIEVVRRASRVTFSCRDDGRGVDLAAVRAAALARGLLASEAEHHGAAELVELLLRGGVSTSSRVTQVAGRGVGLDVVREVAAQLGGKVLVRTEAHHGTTIELAVPFALSSLDALLVEAAGATMAIPLAAVRGAFRATEASVGRTADGVTVLHDGKAIPFVRLTQALGLGAEPLRPGGAWSAVIVGAGAALAAVGVDRLLGTGNVVLRPLPACAPVAPLVAGASLDAEGDPQVVLDPVALCAAARGRQPALAGTASPRPPVLVIDDSLTTRMLEQSILESAGYEVELAISGEEALEKARLRRPALFLVDVEMPGIDGFEFIARAHADAALRPIPSILVTSRSSAEDRRRGAELGVAAYIVKSEFEQREFLAVVRRLVG